MDRHNKDIYKNMNRLKEDRQMVRCFIIKTNMWIDGQIQSFCAYLMSAINL